MNQATHRVPSTLANRSLRMSHHCRPLRQALARSEAVTVECAHESPGILLECRHRFDRFGVRQRVGISNKASSDSEAGRPWITPTE